MKNTVAISYNGSDIKSGIGHIPRQDHLLMLEAAINQISFNEWFIMLSIVGLNLLSWELSDCLHFQKIINQCDRVVALSNDKCHQIGACDCIGQSLEMAYILGSEYLFFMAEDILLDNMTDIDKSFQRLHDENASYLAARYTGNARYVNTQLFACRVKDLYNKINSNEFEKTGLMLEAYMARKITRNGWKYIEETPGYFHTHSAKRLKTAYQEKGIVFPDPTS